MPKSSRLPKKEYYKQPATTETETYLVAADRVGVFAAKRHTDSRVAMAECARLARAHKERFIVLKVTGYVDLRHEMEPEQSELATDTTPLASELA